MAIRCSSAADGQNGFLGGDLWACLFPSTDDAHVALHEAGLSWSFLAPRQVVSVNSYSGRQDGELLGPSSLLFSSCL